MTADRVTRRRDAGPRRRARRLAAGWIGLVVIASVLDPAVLLDAIPGSSTVASGSSANGITGAVTTHIDAFVLSHFVAYGALAWLLASGSEDSDDGATRGFRWVLFAVVLSSLVGLGVELIQSGLSVRTASAADAAVNVLGAISGVGVRGAVRTVFTGRQ